jgi:hypothetical protein
MRTLQQIGGSAPATPGFNAFQPEWISGSGAVQTAPTIPATESALGFHPWRALSSTQLWSEWTNNNLAANDFSANGDNPLKFVSQPRGSLHSCFAARLNAARRGRPMCMGTARGAGKSVRGNIHFVCDRQLLIAMVDIRFRPR